MRTGVNGKWLLRGRFLCTPNLDTTSPLCRSEHARHEPDSAAGYQASSAIVDVHREPARSYRGMPFRKCTMRTWGKREMAFAGPFFMPPSLDTTSPLCRSEHARDGPDSTAGYQASSVIVDVHREPARSYRRSGTAARDCSPVRPPSPASRNPTDIANKKAA